MPVYPGKRPGTQRVVIWVQGKSHERVIKTTPKEAKSFEARWRVELETAEPVDTKTSPTFANFCLTRYRPHARKHLKPSTYKIRKYHMVSLIETKCGTKGNTFTLGELKLTEFRTHHIEAYQDARLKLVKGISVNNELAAFSAILSYAQEDLKLPIGEFIIKPLPTDGEKRVTFWDDARLRAFFAAAQQTAAEYLGIFVFLANTGCRKGEALAAEWSWVDLEHDMIRITPNQFWSPKDKEPREIPISESLRPWFTGPRRSRRWVFPVTLDPKDGSEPGRYAVFPQKQFTRTVRLADRLLCPESCPGRDRKELCRKGHPTMRGGPHTLRHTFAAHFLRAEPDMYLLSRVLGHSETRTTKIYSHLLPDHLARARNKVNISAGVSASEVRAKKAWGTK